MNTATLHRNGISKIRWRGTGAALAFAITSVVAMLATTPAQAQTYAESVLHSFTGTPDAAYPDQMTLAIDAQGNLYGMTEAGGASGNGTVFKVNPSGQETILYSFTGGSDGGGPTGGLILDAQGNLYGTAGSGGDAGCDGGCGTVFELNTSGKETVLYSFTGGTDGYSPATGLILDGEGNLYGTALYGGDFACLLGCGTVFKVDSPGNAIVLYSFTGSTDGAYPRAGLVQDAQGNVYGATSADGDEACNAPNPTPGCGTVFKVDTSGHETVLHTFTGTPDGAFSEGGLILDAKGNLYGTAASGGVSGLGMVFKIDATGKETVLHSFTGGSDGNSPSAGLIFDTLGNLYGTTLVGGASNKGTVFKISATGTETVLYSFGSAGSDGTYPGGALVLDPQANLYGTTFSGGTANLGTVFKLTPLTATTTTLTSSLNPSNYAQAVTFTAAVSSSGGAPPNGETVTFMMGVETLGTEALNGGSATLTTSALAGGTYIITAVYGGDSKFSSSTSNAVSQIVNPPTVPPGIYSPATSSTLTGSAVTFEWGTYAGATAFWLDVGSTQGGNTYYSSGTLPTSTLSQNVSSLPSNGSTVWVRWYYLLNGSWQSIDYSYTAFGGSGKGMITSPAPSSTLPGSSATFSWSAGSGATAYWLDIGSTAGGNNYYSSGNLGNVLTTVASGLPTNGSAVYATLYSLVSGTWLSSAYTYTAYNVAASSGVLTTPAPSSTLTSGTVTFDWTAGAGASAYWLDVGSSAGGNNYYSSGNLGNVLTVTASGLPTSGGTVYVTLYSFIGGSWVHNGYTYMAFNASGGLATIQMPAPGTTLSGSAVTFTWSAGSGATAYWLDVGSVAMGNNCYSSGNLGNVLTTTVYSLPANGSTVYVTLYSLVGGQWFNNSYTYTSAP